MSVHAQKTELHETKVIKDFEDLSSKGQENSSVTVLPFYPQGLDRSS